MITNDIERHQFTCIARNVLKFRTNSLGDLDIPLRKIGMSEFGLTPRQFRDCIEEAKADLAEMHRRDRVRKAGRINFPTDFDECASQIKKITFRYLQTSAQVLAALAEQAPLEQAA